MSTTEIINKINDLVPEYLNKCKEYNKIFGEDSCYYGDLLFFISSTYPNDKEVRKALGKSTNPEDFTIMPTFDNKYRCEYILKSLSENIEHMTLYIDSKTKYRKWFADEYPFLLPTIKEETKSIKNKISKHNSKLIKVIKEFMKSNDSTGWNIKVNNDCCNTNSTLVTFYVKCKEECATEEIGFSMWLQNKSNGKVTINIDKYKSNYSIMFTSSPVSDFWTQCNNAMIKKFETLAKICPSINTLVEKLNGFYPTWFNTSKELQEELIDHKWFADTPESWWWHNIYKKS